jgi:hypothetical protein
MRVGSNRAGEIVPRLLSAHQGKGAPAVVGAARCISSGPSPRITVGALGQGRAGNNKIASTRPGLGAPAVILRPGPDDMETRPTITAGVPCFLCASGICSPARRPSGAPVVFATGERQYWCVDIIICGYSPS